jgi:hypothetical protein
MESKRMLFLNVGWMIRYTGPASDDPTIGNFGYLAGRTHGHESYNYTDQNGWMFGHHPSGSGTNLEKLGAPTGAKSVDHIDVVWFSKHPKSDRAVIVGWYLDATVYRAFQTPQHAGANALEGEPIGFKVKARSADCTLLEVKDRLFPIPGAKQVKGGYGQNVNWYGTDDSFRKTVSSYIENWLIFRAGRIETQEAASPHNKDSELRRLVETTAIQAAIAFYESPAGGSRTVTSVEMEFKGWDLEAQADSDTLLVEVKGLGGSTAIVELTPNEYAQMQRHKVLWVLFVVTDCLSTSPRAIEVRYDELGNCWKTLEGQLIVVTQKIGAVVDVGAI